MIRMIKVLLVLELHWGKAIVWLNLRKINVNVLLFRVLDFNASNLRLEWLVNWGLARRRGIRIDDYYRLNDNKWWNMALSVLSCGETNRVNM